MISTPPPYLNDAIKKQNSVKLAGERIQQYAVKVAGYLDLFCTPQRCNKKKQNSVKLAEERGFSNTPYAVKLASRDRGDRTQ